MPSLTKESLLTKGWQYQHVYRRGHRIRANGFTLIYVSNTVGRNRLGISVSGMKLAVKRNRIKRLIREFYRIHPLFPSAIAGAGEIQGGFDLVVATNSHFVPRGLKHLEPVFLSFLPVGCHLEAAAAGK
ncbi:MAG: ribonuclease P protein component [Deltaproteobacteria bacterium]|nr:ribonuclease P protein component [Deltaproteobacteria bacterium]